VDGLVVGIASRSLPEVIPLLCTMITFVAITSLLGLLPLFQAPTRDLNTTIALSVVSLVATQYFGVRRRGWREYLKSLADPVFMLPLNLIAWASRVMSMSLRLFGNIMAGEVIGGVMFMLLPVLGPLPMNLLGVITNLLQALVFTMLTLVFTIDAMGVEPESSRRSVPARETA
jgi:F-type H+-transporting ATPase subunit a